MLIALGSVGLLFAACNGDDGYDTSGGSRGGDDGFSIRVSVQGQNSGETRATVDPVDGEETVNSLHLLFFEPSTDRSGAMKGYVKVDGPLMMNTNIPVNMTGAVGLVATDPYKVIAVANVDQYAPYLGVSVSEWLGDLYDQTESYVYKQMLAYIGVDQKIDNDKIIMTGEADKASGGVTTMNLTLKRGLVRFDVVNSTRETYDLMSVSIWNAFPETSMFGGGLVDYSKNRIQRFYGIDNNNEIPGNGLAPDISDPIQDNYYGDLFGGLYTLPNQVISPGEKDNRTTCLIIGLQERGTATTTYHRVNINAEDAMQNLKANNAYRLTIRSVAGDGAVDEMTAYTGGVNELEYKINYWDLDDDGLIQQNGNIVLGIPTKRIKFGAEEEERSYDIFAYGGAPGEQINVSTAFDGTAGSYITVTQSGNSIHVNAQALPTDEERTGTITITYGGLTATIAIVQSGTAATFLRVTTSGGAGIPTYPGFAGASMDGTLTVEASKSWHATIYQFGSDDYFSFNQLSAQSAHSSANLTETLPIYTIAENDGAGSRQAFVLIALDGDEQYNYNTALVLTQRALGKIAVSPSVNKIEWDGLGYVSGSATVTDYKLNVITTLDASDKYEEWEAVLMGGDEYFEIVTAATNYDETVLANNYVTVKAKGETTSGTHTGVLRVRLKSAPSTTYVDITLSQAGYTMGLSPSTFSAISSKGGQTNAVTVTTNGSSLTWSAEVTATTAASGTLDPTLAHKAVIIDATAATELVQGTKYALSQKFRVKFPKLYYGDHMKGDVTATVVVKLWSGSAQVGEQTITVKQNALMPNNVNILNVHGTSYAYGALSSSGSYASAYRLMLNTFFTAGGSQVPSYPAATPTVNYIYTPQGVSVPSSHVNLVSSVASNVTYLHASNYSRIDTDSPARSFGAMEAWRAADYGVMVIVQDRDAESGTDSRIFSNSSSSVAKQGWTRNGDVETSSKVPNSGSSAKIADFIYRKGPFGQVSGLSSSNFNSDGASNSVILPSGSKAVPILGTNSDASLVIDPQNRIVFIGESQMFSSSGDPQGIAVSGYPSTALNAKTRLLANVYAYIILTAQYGSSFSDLFVD